MKIEILDISKTFGDLKANDGISFTLDRGEIVSILGENGAGKTTLVRMLTGLYGPDSGDILVNGKSILPLDPVKARELSIGMVHQHLLLIDNFTVWENIVLGAEGGRPFLNKKEYVKKLESLKREYGLTVNLERKAGEISVGEKQQTELLKLLYKNYELLIFDEPTALLAEEEIKGLYKVFRELAASGKTIIFITHKLSEIFEVSTRVIAMSKGKVLGDFRASEVSEKHLIDILFKCEEKQYDHTAPGEEPYIVFEQVYKKRRLNIKDLKLHRKRILGIAGIEGNGQKEFFDVIVGAADGIKKIFLDGRDVSGSLRQSIALIPEDRTTEALVPEMPLSENYLLSPQNLKPGPGGMIDRKGKKKKMIEEMEHYGVKYPSASAPASSLSGGNQQKFILSREFSADKQVIIAKNPTRGLDLASVRFVHDLLMEARDMGKAILIFSTELEELLKICDDIAVMFKGEIVLQVERKDFSRIMIGQAMLGIKEKEHAR